MKYRLCELRMKELIYARKTIAVTNATETVARRNFFRLCFRNCFTEFAYCDGISLLNNCLLYTQLLDNGVVLFLTKKKNMHLQKV